MTTSDNVSAIEAIEKALEGVTPGKWESEHGSAYGPVMSYNVSANTRKVRSPVVCHIVDHPEAKANAAYIAACSPERMRSVLSAARRVEALEREIAEKDARIDALELTIRFVALWAWRDDPRNANSKLTDAERLSVIKHHPTVKSVYETGARALLSKDNAEQDGSTIVSSDNSKGRVE